MARTILNGLSKCRKTAFLKTGGKWVRSWREKVRRAGPLYAEVLEIKAETVVIDTNHPLAGETLFFDVKILKVETVSEQQ